MYGRFIQTVAVSRKLFRLDSFRIWFAQCSMCGPTLLVKLAETPIGVRCTRCRGSAIHMSIVNALKTLKLKLAQKAVYEMSSRGPLFDYMKRTAGHFTFSEFYDDVAPGEYKGEIQCQDVQRLTFADNSFDLCTSTEVFEHVPDDHAGFREVLRVLRPDGQFVFTVPLTESAVTVERAVVLDGNIKHLMSPEYHGDTIRGFGNVLCFRNYGLDILERLRSAGFRQAKLVTPVRGEWWGLGVTVVVAGK